MSNLVWPEDTIKYDNFVTVVAHAMTTGLKVKVFQLPYPEYDLSVGIESQDHPLKDREVSAVGQFLTDTVAQKRTVFKTENPRVYRVQDASTGWGVFLG